MYVGTERISVENNAGTVLNVKVAVNDILQVESVASALDVVCTIESKRTFVVVVCLQGSIAIGGDITIVGIVHSKLDFAVGVEMNTYIHENVTSIWVFILLLLVVIFLFVCFKQ